MSPVCPRLYLCVLCCLRMCGRSGWLRLSPEPAFISVFPVVSGCAAVQWAPSVPAFISVFPVVSGCAAVQDGSVCPLSPPLSLCSLLSQDVRPFSELRLCAEPGDILLEAVWNPVQSDLVAAVFQSGSLALFQVAADTGTVTVHRLPAAVGVR